MDWCRKKYELRGKLQDILIAIKAIVSARKKGRNKGVQKLQKLHGVGKFFNGWRPDPPPLPPKKGNIGPKKEISDRKRKSHKEHKKSMNVRKDFLKRKKLWIVNLSIANHHWHVH